MKREGKTSGVLQRYSAIASRCLQLSTLLVFVWTTAQAQPDSIQRIAFGSCVDQDTPQPIWTHVLADDPDVFVFLGDNIYGDSDDPAVLQAKYQQQMARPAWQELFATTEVIATWDDHDYGQNDIGADYRSKDASRRIMLDFFNEPAESERRSRPDGIYTSYLYGEPGQQVQIILLDLRWNRSELIELRDPGRLAERERQDRGPYEASLSADATLLGEAQWRWLEEQLQVEADIRIIGSSIQLLAEFTGWETWANYPRDRLRFIQLLERYQAEPIVIISGDVHWAEFSEIENTPNGWPLVELTSSGLTETWEAISPNRHRVGEAFAVPNYGLIEIDWGGAMPAMTLLVKDEDGETLIRRELAFD
jgi:alkaline phosphatase D